MGIQQFLAVEEKCCVDAIFPLDVISVCVVNQWCTVNLNLEILPHFLTWLLLTLDLKPKNILLGVSVWNVFFPWKSVCVMGLRAIDRNVLSQKVMRCTNVLIIFSIFLGFLMTKIKYNSSFILLNCEDISHMRWTTVHLMMSPGEQIKSLIKQRRQFD